ncbi:DUF1800 domain-containing protein [Aquabacterium sp.]|uniref:DUF1800 domain-containing protein n=1 Tax=Aquabacterium sp. TaxID=1872578 RepID=UPI0019B65FB8|nr:DUF1800 domain-containing protein [Aquabacterium sp.]MBC7701984.1 DUF1800 domain-containing protein [Aquabacterium sp.]
MTARRAEESVGTEPLARPLALGSALLTSAALAACGGGAKATDAQIQGGNPTPLPKADAAARFLAQAGLGATPDSIGALLALPSYDAWLDQQFALPIDRSVFDMAKDLGVADAIENEQFQYQDDDTGLDNSLWFRLFKAHDVLRQRTVLALSELFVVSQRNMPVPWGQFCGLAYWDLLEQHCFGNFRDLIEHITLSPAMGVYLSMRASQKADEVSGRQPDENYARELLQLFTIGLVQLQHNGTPVLVNGKQVETYTNQDITGLAKVFTGWDFDVSNLDAFGYNLDTDAEYTRRPMKLIPGLHADDAKTFLGTTIEAGLGGAQDLKLALDAVYNHDNVGPFIARQLIQRLISSNPEPDHVAHVASVFNSNADGVRGDMKAVIRAVLMHPLARDVLVGDAALRRCKLREPILRLVQWGRLVNISSTNNRWDVGDLSYTDKLAQSPLRSPSVFNFFRPGYVPLNSGLSADHFVAPEFQITDESTVVGYANFMLSVIPEGDPGSGLAVDYRAWEDLADDPARLVDGINWLLTGHALISSTVDLIVEAIKDLNPPNDAELRYNRTRVAFFLAMTSPDYLVQR